MHKRRAEEPMPQMPDIFGNPNSIQARHHSLFWEEVPAEMINLTVQLDGVDTTVQKMEPAYTLYKLFIGTFDSDTAGLHKIINQLHQAKGADFLEIHVASRGGALDELTELSNAIKATFGSGPEAAVVVYINHAYSAGAMISLLGATRVVYEDSDLLFHSYAGGAYGKRDDMISQLEHGDRQASRYMKRIISDQGYLSDKEFKEMQSGKDFWMDSTEMLKRNIATHILIDGQMMTRKEYKKYRKSQKV